MDLLPGCALHRLAAGTSQEVLRALCARVEAAGCGRDSLTAAVLAREERFPTGLPTPVPMAIPHTDPEHVLRPGVAVATLAEPVEFRQMGDAAIPLPVRLVVLLCVTDPADQVGALTRILARGGDEAAVRALVEHPDPEGFEEAVRGWLSG